METRLRELREEKNLLQKDIAFATKIDVRTISNLENSKTLPNAEQLVKLAKFFSVSVDYILKQTSLRNYKNEELVKVFDDITKQINEVKSFFK